MTKTQWVTFAAGAVCTLNGAGSMWLALWYRSAEWLAFGAGCMLVGVVLMSAVMRGMR